jgi:hypothetical protein
VLLPGTSEDTELPLSLRPFSRVSLADPEALEKLEWGINGTPRAASTSHA